MKDTYTPARYSWIIGALLFALLVIESYCGYQVHVLTLKHQTLKRDYARVNNISHGLLSVSRWRDVLVSSVSKRIDDFNFTKQQKDSLRKEINQLLYSLVDKADSIVNAPGGSLGTKIKKWALRSFIDKKKLHEQVPALTNKILAEVEKPSSKQRLKFLAKNKLEEMSEDTYDSSHDAKIQVEDSIFSKYSVEDAAKFEQQTENSLTQTSRETELYTAGVFCALALLNFFWWPLRKQKHLHAMLFFFSLFAAAILLFTGVTTPMIEIDARIKQLDFHLLGQTIVFKNQVIYYQSKSILDVIRILVQTHKYDSILVGILILAFSVIFPLAKLISTGIYLSGTKPWTKSSIIQFFAFKSGKWSMADVIVVAIFMAYIGFNGILNNQLSNLDIKTETLTSISTNDTSLQAGYPIFVGFVLYGLILSEVLKRIKKK